MNNAKKLNNYFITLDKVEQLMLEGKYIQAYNELSAIMNPFANTISSVDQIETYYCELIGKKENSDVKTKN